MEDILPEKQPEKTADVIHRETQNISAERERKLEVLENIAAEAESSTKEHRPSGTRGKETVLDLHLAKPRIFPRGIIWGVFALILIFLSSFGYYLYASVSIRFSRSVATNLGKFQSGVEDLKKLDSKSAEKKFSAASNDLNLTFGDFLSKFKPFFEGTSQVFGGFQKLANLSLALTQEASFFENNLLTSFLDKKGNEIIDHLEKAQGILTEINAESDRLSSGVDKLKNISPDILGNAYLSIQLDVVRLQKLLSAVLAWLKSDSPRHLLIMLQNPSEIRPAGGFLGSYADLTINKASLEGILVHDVNDADRLLDLKVIPPRPLQAEVTRWRAADANWFFDFSESAAEVIKLVEASKLYPHTTTTSVNSGDAGHNSSFGVGTSTTFDAAIAVSPVVIRDLLALGGPVELKDERLVLDKDNFLIEIQKKVQAGQAQRTTYPKSVLSGLSREIIAKLGKFDDAERQKLFGLLGGWLAKKDLMFYFKDPELQKFMENFGVAGRLYDEPANFEGDYLALVDANVGGGKSDLFVKQSVELQSQINASGTVTNHLVINRAHEGDKSKYWWYKVANEDYLQVFVPDPSQLINFRGGIEKKIIPAANYAKNGYLADPFVAEIESSTEKIFNYPAVLGHKENGKQVFATWVKIGPGEKKEIVFDYSHRLFLAPVNGTEYQFVFEKQAGTTRHYKFEISAPVGYKFKENNLPVYEYESDDPPGRLVVNLTLEKI